METIYLTVCIFVICILVFCLCILKTRINKLIYVGEHDLIHRYNLALDASRIATWEWNIEFNIVTFDHRWQKIFSVNMKNYEDFLSNLKKEEVEKVDQAVKDALDGKREYNIVCELENGKFIKAVADVVRDDMGRPVKMVGVCIDLTSEIVRERFIERSLKDLGNTKEKLETMNKNMEQFVYIVSHDLQSPARKINEFFRLLKEEIPEESILSLIHI